MDLAAADSQNIEEIVDQVHEWIDLPDHHLAQRGSDGAARAGSPETAPSGAPSTDPASLQRCIGTGRRRRIDFPISCHGTE